jgi:hypothetical protein
MTIAGKVRPPLPPDFTVTVVERSLPTSRIIPTIVEDTPFSFMKTPLLYLSTY